MKKIKKLTKTIIADIKDYFKLWTSGIIKLPGNTERNFIKEKNSSNVPNLEISDVPLVTYNTLNNGCQQD